MLTSAPLCSPVLSLFPSALKTKGNTPKYGLIFHSSFIGRAGAKHKGRISRYLANKCSMASRIDSFSDVPDSGRISNIYGTKLKEQVEERLEFYKTGAAPKKNIDVMHAAMKEAGDDGVGGDEKKSEKKEKKDKKKDKKKEKEVKMEVEEEAPVKEEKKSKKRKAESDAEDDEAAAKAAKKEAKKAKKAKKESSD